MAHREDATATGRVHRQSTHRRAIDNGQALQVGPDLTCTEFKVFAMVAGAVLQAGMLASWEMIVLDVAPDRFVPRQGNHNED